MLKNVLLIILSFGFKVYNILKEKMMSMQKTISKGETFHFFEEALDNTKVYLEFEEVELDLRIRRNGRSVVRMAIPIEEWRHIISGWQQTEWASDARRDYSPIDITKEAFDTFVDKFRERYPDVFSNDEPKDQSE